MILSLHTQKGFSLPGILVSVAVSAILAFAVAQLVLSLAKTRGSVEFRTDVDRDFEILRLAFLVEEFCNKNLENKIVTPQGLELDQLVNKNNQILVKRGSPPGFHISSLKIYQDLKLDDHLFFARLEVSYAKGAATSSAPSLSRQKSLTLGYETDTSGRVLRCHLGLHPE